MQAFISTQVPEKSKEARKLSLVAKRKSKSAKARTKPGTCVVVYTKTA